MPSGNMEDALFSRRRGLSMELHATHTTLAFPPVVVALGAHVDHAGRLAAHVVLDPQHHGVRPDLHGAGFLARWDLRVECGPLGAHLAALEAEAELPARRPPVPRLAVGGGVAGGDLLVAELARAGLQNLGVVAARQARDAVRPAAFPS